MHFDLRFYFVFAALSLGRVVIALIFYFYKSQVVIKKLHSVS